MIFQILLAITVLASSACGLIIEIVAGRLLAPVFGMSLYTWTSIIAVVLAGLSVGHWIGGHLTRGTFVKRAQFMKIGCALFLSSLTSLLILLLLDFIVVGPKRHHRNVLRPGHHLVVACRYLRGGHAQTEHNTQPVGSVCACAPKW